MLAVGGVHAGVGGVRVWGEGGGESWEGKKGSEGWGEWFCVRGL